MSLERLNRIKHEFKFNYFRHQSCAHINFSHSACESKPLATSLSSNCNLSSDEVVRGDWVLSAEKSVLLRER